MKRRLEDDGMMTLDELMGLLTKMEDDVTTNRSHLDAGAVLSSAIRIFACRHAVPSPNRELLFNDKK